MQQCLFEILKNIFFIYVRFVFIDMHQTLGFIFLTTDKNNVLMWSLDNTHHYMSILTLLQRSAKMGTHCVCEELWKLKAECEMAAGANKIPVITFGTTNTSSFTRKAVQRLV